MVASQPLSFQRSSFWATFAIRLQAHYLFVCRVAMRGLCRAAAPPRSLCRLCMLPVSCLDPIAHAAGAVSASRLTCTASWLAVVQQYGTSSYFDVEIGIKPDPPGFGYSQIDNDRNREDSDDSEWTYTYETIDDDEF